MRLSEYIIIPLRHFFDFNAFANSISFVPSDLITVSRNFISKLIMPFSDTAIASISNLD
ncbi:MAG TPA: hypothetical protein PLM75_04775 [bacterium]|nr:hypothetical protein [bacterium]HPP87156.1 hypothetical protein [bacterium]